MLSTVHANTPKRNATNTTEGPFSGKMGRKDKNWRHLFLSSFLVLLHFFHLFEFAVCKELRNTIYVHLGLSAYVTGSKLIPL